MSNDVEQGQEAAQGEGHEAAQGEGHEETTPIWARGGSVKIYYDTLDYKRSHSKLPWCDRIAARNWLSTLYATTASV